MFSFHSKKAFFFKTKKGDEEQNIFEKSKKIRYYQKNPFIGKVAEWTNAPVLKTDVVLSYRGFESLPSRLSLLVWFF